MFRSLTLAVVISVLCTSALAQQSTEALKKSIEAIMKDFKGQAGVYVKNLRTGSIIAINADTVFPTASMVKLPILIGITDKIERKELSDTTTLVYKDSLLYAGVDILGSFKHDEKIELGKLIMLMLTTSDNTASLWLQSLAGRGERINELMDSLGFERTRVNSRTSGREANRAQYGWGQTTPREMATLLENISRGRVISQKASEEMLRALSRNYWDDVSLSEIPAGVFVASKNGAVDASRSEVVLVNAPGNPYVFCICTKNNQDTGWESTNEAWVMAKKISAVLWKTYGNSAASKSSINLIAR